MRSFAPQPENPWPHDMAITVEDEPHLLLELLWVRDAYGLRPAGEAPPALTDPPALRACPEREEWESAWPELWADAVTHTAGIRDPALFEELQRTADGSVERAKLLQRLVGSGWRDRFGDAALDADYDAWQHRRFALSSTSPATAPEEMPERRALDALIPAWRAGLTKVATIPCTGDFTRVIGPQTLLMTERTRTDAADYAEALRSFARR